MPSIIAGQSLLVSGGFSARGSQLARSFNGSSDFIAASPNLSAYNKLSIAFWLNWTTFANNDDLAMEFSTNYGSNNGAFIVDPNSNGPTPGVMYFAWNQTSITLARFTRPSAGWHQYVFLIDGTASGSASIPAIYVDGVSQSLTYDLTGSVAGSLGNYSLYLMSRAGSTLFGAGSMADVALWGGVLLNATQASNLAAGRRANTIGATANLVGYWPILGQSPEPDKCNGNNGVLTGTTVVTGPPSLQPYWNGPVLGNTHRWQMDSGSISGGVVSDLSGSLGATIVSSPTNVSSPSGAFASTGLSFNGTTDQLNLASNPVVLSVSDNTIAFWVNLPDITQTPSEGGDPRFFDFGDSGNYIIVANLATTGPVAGQLDWDTNYGPGGADTNGAVLTNNTWVHLAMTLTSGGAGTFTLYVNGSSVTKIAGSSDGGSGTASTIACRGDNLRHTKGIFYQFVTYNRILSAGEITQLYNAK